MIVWAEAGDVNAYLEEISKQCETTYYPLQGFEVCKASVTFEVDRDGHISNITINEHPRHVQDGQTSDVADHALIDAIKNLGRLPPPKEVLCPVSVGVTFDGRSQGPMKITAAFKGLPEGLPEGLLERMKHAPSDGRPRW